MAGGKVKYTDIYDSNLSAEISSLTKQLELQQKIIDTIKKSGKLSITKSGDGKELQKQVEYLGKSKEAVKKIVTASQEKLKIEKQINDAFVKNLANSTKDVQNKQRILQSAREQAKYQKQINELSYLETEAGKKSLRQKYEANKKIREIKQAQKAVTDETNNWKTALGSFPAKFNTIGNILGGAVLQAANKVGQGLRNAFNTAVDFEKSMAKVKAISGATNSEFNKLNDLSRELGATTEYTASQVANLELQLAKLGFNTNDIVNMTGAILDLATATDEDLGQSSETVGATMRAFGLQANETQRVVDVMAKSFSSSALDLNKFSTAMSTVAPVAKTFGFSVEETTALLAQLVNAGFDASSAGTALRNILLNLADSNGALAQKLGGSVNSAGELLDGLKKLDASGVSLAETLELTDKRSVAAFNQFMETADSAKVLTDELYNAGGSAKEMAEIMRDTLSGDLEILKSTMEGAVLDGGMPLNFIFRAIVQSITWLVSNIDTLITGFTGYMLATKGAVLWTTLFKKGAEGAASGLTKMGSKISEFLSKNFWGLMAAGAAIVIKELISLWRQTNVLDDALDEAQEKVSEFRAEMQILEGRLESTRKGTDDYNLAIEELNRKLGAMGEAQLGASASSEELAGALKLVREETEKQIRLEVYREKLKEIMAVQIQYGDMLDDLRRKHIDSGTSFDLVVKGYENATKQVDALQNRIDGLTDSYGLFNVMLKKNTEVVQENVDITGIDFAGAIKKAADETKKFEEQAIAAKQAMDDWWKKQIEISKPAPGLSIIRDDMADIEMAASAATDEIGMFTAEVEKIDAPIDAANMSFSDLIANFRSWADANKEDLNSLLDFFDESLGSLTDILNDFNQIRIDKLNEEIDRNKELLATKEEALAVEEGLEEEGLANSADRIRQEIALEKKKQAELLKEQKKAQRQQQALAKAGLTIDYIAEIGKIALNSAALGPIAGPIVAAIQIALATGRYAAGLAQINAQKFNKGTEYVDLMGNPDGTDTVPAWLDKGERVVDKHENKKLLKMGVKNNQLSELVAKGMILDKALSGDGHTLAMISEMQKNNNLLQMIERAVSSKEWTSQDGRDRRTADGMIIRMR